MHDAFGLMLADDIGLAVEPSTIGPCIGRGEHMECFLHRLDRNKVIKLPRDTSSDTEWLENRRLRSIRIVRDRLCPDSYSPVSAGRAVGDFEGRYCELQEKVGKTVQDACAEALNRGDIETAKNIVLGVFAFEADCLWARGVIVQDTASLFENIEYRGGSLSVFDFCSVDDRFEIGELFFEGPWRLFRITGIADRFERLGATEDETVTEYIDWFRRKANNFYRKDIFRAHWRRGLGQERI